MDELASIISTVGFPIVSFLLAGYFIKYSYDAAMTKDKEHDAREDEHWKELSKLTQAVSENSTAIRELIQETRQNKDNYI